MTRITRDEAVWAQEGPKVYIIECANCEDQIGGLELNPEMAKNAAIKLGARRVELPWQVTMTRGKPILCQKCLQLPFSTHVVEEISADEPKQRVEMGRDTP